MSTTTKTSAEYLADAGISDPTPALVEMADGILSDVREALKNDPTLNDYAGAITAIGDQHAAGIDLSDVAGSVDFLSYEHGFGDDGGGIGEMVKMNAYEIACSIAARVADGERPDAPDFDTAPDVAHGDHLIGYSDADHYVYVGAEWRGGRLSISGHTTNGSAGQMQDALRADDFVPAPGWTAEDVARLSDVWDRWHLNDMQAACEHQRARGETYQTHPGAECPDCGYALGSAWRHEDVPAEPLDFLRSHGLI